jgi:hypothetical protein
LRTIVRIVIVADKLLGEFMDVAVREKELARTR